MPWTGRTDTRRQQCGNGGLETRLVRPIRIGVIAGCRTVDLDGRQTFGRLGQIRLGFLHGGTFRVFCQVDDPPQPSEAHTRGQTCPGNSQAIVMVTALHALDAIPCADSACILWVGAPICLGGHHIDALSAQSRRDRSVDGHIHGQPPHDCACSARAATSLGCGLRISGDKRGIHGHLTIVGRVRWHPRQARPSRSAPRPPGRWR
jgi:hypothetical protein